MVTILAIKSNKYYSGRVIILLKKPDSRNGIVPEKPCSISGIIPV